VLVNKSSISKAAFLGVATGYRGESDWDDRETICLA
jgi:hypothetical protein